MVPLTSANLAFSIFIWFLILLASSIEDFDKSSFTISISLSLSERF